MAWKTIEDAKVRHIWTDSSGEEHAVPPTYYEENGTPIDAETGDDMTYTCTEIEV